MSFTDSLYPDWEVPPLPRVKKRGHAAQPGTGPEGETCKSCTHYTRTATKARNVFRKCGLMKSKWTNGPGTDIRAGDPACEFWSVFAPPAPEGD